MEIAKTTVGVSDLVKEMTLTVHITGKRRAALRLRIAGWVLYLAAVVGGFGIRRTEYDD